MSERPRMHGRTHTPGGSDPIPGTGCCPPDATPCTPFPDKVTEIADGYAANSLLGWWRLGDGATPFADISGHSAGAANAAKTTTGTAMTDSVAGALPAGDDDGAVQFNSTDGTAGDYLHAAEPGTPRFNLPNDNMTVTAWVKPSASASTFDGLIAGTWTEVIGLLDGGWRLAIQWPARTPVFERNQGVFPGGTDVTVTGSALTADEWVFLAATYDTTGGAALYVNGVLVDSDATLSSALTTNDGVWFGHAQSATAFQAFYGGVDEVTVWHVALTGSEIASLYTAGLPCVGGGDAGQVVTADGDGATTWSYPTVKVDGTRYDEILAGANLTSTDNLDGTVTLDASDSGGASPADTACWMPLTTTVGGDDVLVFDADHSLIPTLVPF